MYYNAYSLDRKLVHRVKGSDLELAFFAANFPNIIVFETEEDLGVQESFYGPSHWESMTARGFQGYDMTLQLCPRCGAAVSMKSKITHILWHFNNPNERRAVASKPVERKPGERPKYIHIS